MKKISTLLLFLFFSNIFITAQFVYGDDLLEEEVSAIQPPIKTLQPSFSHFIVSSEKTTTLKAGTDTKIVIPPNAFVSREGNVIRGKVDIQYREFKNPLDIFLSGIPMTVEENGKKEFFQSAGMVEFRASKNGEEVFPNPESETISIEISSSQTDEDFNLYTLDENSGEWNEEGKDEVVFNSQRENPGDASFLGFQNLPGNMPILPNMEIARPYINKLNRKDNYWLRSKKHFLQFTIQGFQNFKGKGSNFYGKYFSELKSKKPPIWIHDGKNRKTASKLLSKLARANNTSKKEIDSLEHYIVEDIQITPNLKGDNYIINFHCRKNKTWTIEAYPYLSNNAITEQKRNKYFYTKHKEVYNKRCEKWKKTEEEYQIALEKFKTDLMEYKPPSGLPPVRSRRLISVNIFGILNIDKIMKKSNEERPLVINLENGMEADIQKIHLLDNTNNALLSYDAGQNILFDKKAKNSLIIALKDDSFATISPSEFKSVFKKSRKKDMVFTLKNIQLEILTRKILSDALAAN